MGIASYLIEMLERIAKENRYKGFYIWALCENKAIMRVVKKRYPNVKISMESGREVKPEMKF